MKKTITLLCFVLVFTLLFSSLCFAEENTDTLVSWDIKITVPDGKDAVLKGNEYYIYGQETGSIPYVMLTTYRYDSEAQFIKEFTAFMQQQYHDLKVAAEAAPLRVGDKDCVEIDYGYTVSGYDVRDRRIVIIHNGMTYLFASKEIDELGMTIGNMLEEVVAKSEFLTAESGTEAKGFTEALLCCKENGMPKYWLDLSGKRADAPVLHCYFRSGDPTFYEKVFVLEPKEKFMDDGLLTIGWVIDERGNDVSGWFESLSLKLSGDSAVMLVKRDEKTLAGGPEDNILTGNYLFEPVGLSEGQDHLRPLEDGPYTVKELARWAQISYFHQFGFYPPLADVEKNDDGSFTIHLYELVTLDGTTHTATSAWYSVDAFGSGVNDLTGEAVELCR